MEYIWYLCKIYRFRNVSETNIICIVPIKFSRNGLVTDPSNVLIIKTSRCWRCLRTKWHVDSTCIKVYWWCHMRFGEMRIDVVENSKVKAPYSSSQSKGKENCSKCYNNVYLRNSFMPTTHKTIDMITHNHALSVHLRNFFSHKRNNVRAKSRFRLRPFFRCGTEEPGLDTTG